MVKTAAYGTNLTRRFFVLTLGRLCYFEDETQCSLLGSIDLVAPVKIQLPEDISLGMLLTAYGQEDRSTRLTCIYSLCISGLRFTITTKEKTLEVSTQNEQKMNHWVNEIQNATIEH